jgi:hypothetical protein
MKILLSDRGDHDGLSFPIGETTMVSPLFIEGVADVLSTASAKGVSGASLFVLRRWTEERAGA